MKSAHAHSPLASSHEPDLRVWLNDQRIGLRPPESGVDVSPAPSPADPEGTISRTEVPRTEVPGTEVTYQGQFLRSRPELERPTRILHVSERVHRFIAFLTALPEGKNRPTMTEVVENLLDEHLDQHGETIERLRREYCNRQLRAF